LTGMDSRSLHEGGSTLFCGTYINPRSNPQRLLSRRVEEGGIDFSAERALEALETVRLVTFRLGARAERRGVSGGCPDARRVLKALKLSELTPPSPPAGQETVM
jgi:hypothetical protein